MEEVKTAAKEVAKAENKLYRSKSNQQYLERLYLLRACLKELHQLMKGKKAQKAYPKIYRRYFLPHYKGRSFYERVTTSFIAMNPPIKSNHIIMDDVSF